MTDVLLRSSGWVQSDPASDPALRRSLDRLLRDDYLPSKVVRDTMVSDWPGDLAGRLLLSLSRGARLDARVAARARDLQHLLVDALSPLGYLGEPRTAIIDEQQVACHGWVAAALVQFAESFDELNALTAAERVVDELILPALRNLGEYPLQRPRTHDGGPSGTATATIGNWKLSSDTWCVLLTLNALVPVYQATARPDIGSAISRVAELLEAVDLVEQEAQLHATLSAARNLAVFAEVSGDERALRVADALYRCYVAAGRTLNFSTYNWFGRADSWTEPCAVVDSIGLALALWRVSGDDSLLSDVRRIERNALSFAQRHDGSFGLDSVATPAAPLLKPLVDDAWWCCTLRGALGVFDVRDRSFRLTGHSLDILFPRTGTIRHGEWTIASVHDESAGTLSLTLLGAPDAVSGIKVQLHGEPGPARIYGPLSRDEPRLHVTITPRGAVAEKVAGRYLHLCNDVVIAREQDGRGVRLDDVDLAKGVDEGAGYALLSE